MQYENVGVYNICRILKGYDKEYFYEVANRERSYLINESWGKVTAYMDEAEIGSVCARTELSRMFADAAAGKLDHIRIHSYYDMWHDPQIAVEEICKLREANPTIEISFYLSAQDKYPLRIWDKHLSFDRLVLEMLDLSKMVGDLRCIQSCYYQLSPQVRNMILQHNINPYKLVDFLDFFYLEPKGLELEDLEKTLGLSKNDIELIRFAADPSDEGYAKLMDWILQDLLAYYLV